MNITDSTRIKRKDTILSTQLDGEYVMMDIESGGYFSLKNVAAAIWDLIEEETSVADVKAALLQRYDISAEVCDTEVRAFLTDIVGADIADIK